MAKNTFEHNYSVQEILNKVYDPAAGTLATGTTSTADGATFTQGTDQGNLALGVYTSSPQTLTTGKTGVIAVDVNRNVLTNPATGFAGEDLTNQVLGTQRKPVASSTYAPAVYAPLTQVTKANIKASAGNVFSIYITNDNATVRYFQLHNKATAPAGTDVPLHSFKVPAGTANNPGVLILDSSFFSNGGSYLSTGIGWAISTTFGTFTDSATNTEHIVEVVYI